MENALFTIASFSYLTGTFLYILFASINRKSLSKTGFIALVIGLAAHTGAIVIRWIAGRQPPMSNMFETMSLFAWAIILIYLIVELKYHWSVLGILTAPIAFLLMAVASVLPKEIQPLVPALKSFWLQIHVITAFLGYAAFAVSFAATILYLGKLRENFLDGFGILAIGALSSAVVLAVKFSWNNPAVIALGPLGVLSLIGVLSCKGPGKGLFASLAQRLADLDTIDLVSYKLVTIGFPFLTLAIISGALWAQNAWGRYWGWDPKETWALITWIIYAIYLHARLVRGLRGRAAAYFNILGFLAVVFTYLGVNFLLGGLHTYV